MEEKQKRLQEEREEKQLIEEQNKKIEDIITAAKRNCLWGNLSYEEY